jgi:predicted helicase
LSPAASGTKCLPLFIYDSDNERIDNITDWSLSLFRDYYVNKKITKRDIFFYVYASLHDPEYRKKFILNLKFEFPRISLHSEFSKWRNWGKKLMNMHINYETAKPYPLKRIDMKCENNKAKLKADKEHGIIILDDETTLTGVPSIAWEYKLGNRSAIEWVLDQYKEKTPKDPTIREKFNTYRFADYKEHVIDLLMRVCTVSVETMKVVGEMEDGVKSL